MPKINLGRLKAAVLSRETSRSTQASISSFFSPKTVREVNEKAENSSKKRTSNELPSNNQETKRQKLSHKTIDLTAPNNNASSNSMTKLKVFERDSQYFTRKDSKSAEYSNTNTEDDSSGCIIMHDNRMEKSEEKTNFSCFRRNTTSDSKEKSSSIAKNPRTKTQYTPLELQFIEIKEKYKDAVLFVECGYKYKFFGEDAEIASKELNIMCFMDHNFMVASIPTHRLHVHVKRLVNKGYKVGVVKQTETAALKAASDNKSNVFSRQLSALYTKSTLIGEDMQVANDSSDNELDNCGSYLMCLCQSETEGSPTKAANEEIMTFSFVAVCPLTGDVIYDEFNDTPRCSELETRLQHIGITELLISDALSQHMKSFIKMFTSQSRSQEDSIRVEELPSKYFTDESAKQIIKDCTSQGSNTDNSTDKNGESTSKDSVQDTIVHKISSLPTSTRVCYAVLFRYLKDFKLERVLGLSSNIVRFTSTKEYMKLDGCTVKNLELFKNEVGSEQCTLFWVLNHTSTKFGKRLLKKWISQPLVDTREIESRLEGVSGILLSEASCLRKLKSILVRLPDLERGLCSIYSKKCSTTEFLTILKSLINVYEIVSASQLEASKELTSPMLSQIFTEVPRLLKGADKFMNMIDQEAARTGDKTKLFRDETQFPDIEKCTKEMKRIVGELKSHRTYIRKTLQHPSLDYCTVAGNEFLIEVRNAKLGCVPSDWIKISATKQVCRFRTPFVEEQYKLLCQQREMMSQVCNQAWLDYLDMVNQRYPLYIKAVQIIAVVDCLFSLATVAKQPGYVRPVLQDLETAELQIIQGRHPILDALLSESEQYVPNDTKLQGNGNRCMVITGPNMGGKSCYIKQVALIAIMAQIGSFVPATQVKLKPLDAIYTRMGASDNIYKGRSTFMVELQEAAFILDQATSRSLVILDELGRGTSTHDGIAVAYATLRHIVEKIGSLTLFVTHYPNIAEVQKIYPDHVTNNHMAFMTSSDSDHQSPEKDAPLLENNGKCLPSVTFLYRLVEGVAERSYGLNVARLAGIPRDILEVASHKSRELENEIVSRRLSRKKFQQIWSATYANEIQEVCNVE